MGSDVEVDTDSAVGSGKTPEELAARERQVRYSRFVGPKVTAYMREWPFPGPHSTPAWWVTLKPRFPDWQAPKKMDQFWTPREPRGMAPFEVYRGHHFCGSVTRWESGEWLAWRAPDEVEESPSPVTGRMTGSLLAIRRTRSRAVAALLEFHRSGVEPEHEDSPVPERFPGRQATRHFLVLVENAVDRFPHWRRGQAFFNTLYELRPEWADEVRGSDKDPFHEDRRIGDFLALVRGKFHAEALRLEQDVDEVLNAGPKGTED